MSTEVEDLRGVRGFFHMLGLNADRRLREDQSGVIVALKIQPYGFFDEGGKWQDKDFICLCGYLSTELGWERFIADWRRLTTEHQISSVHMTTFYTQAKDKGWDDNKTESVLQEFCGVVRRNIIVGFAVGIDTRHYWALPKTVKDGIPKPDTACLQRLLRMIRDRLTREGYNGRISVTLDEEEGEVIKVYQEILRLRRANPDLGRFVGAISFADDEFILPLQAADMLANLTFRWFKDRLHGSANPQEMPEPLKSLIIDPRTGYGMDYEQEFWDAEALDRGLAELLGK